MVRSRRWGSMMCVLCLIALPSVCATGQGADGAAVGPMDADSVDAVYGSTPSVDGVLSAGEWDGAASVEIVAAGRTGTVLVMQDASDLFVAFEYNATNWCEVFFDKDHDGTAAPGTDDLCLHASSALGERTGTGTTWSGWTWNTVTGWTATKEFGYVHEFRVSFSKLGITRDQPMTLGLAFQLFTNTETRTWPLGADDDVPSSWGDLGSSDSWGTGAPNVPPVLSGGQASALNVTEDDPVTFKVLYADADDEAPASMKVVLRNGTAVPEEHPLDPEAGTGWTAGRWLAWTSRLPPGTYAFRFNASDGRDWARGDTGWSPSEVLVRPRNRPPQLSSPSHTPASGDTTTRFNFEVLYRDPDGQAPASATVVIDGTPHPMVTEAVGPWDEWQVFHCETVMGAGEDHRYHFSFSDGAASVRLPLTGTSPDWLSGPDVRLPNTLPGLSEPSAAPPTGTRGTEFTFTVVYTDADGQHPTVSTVVINGEARAMVPAGTNYAGGVAFTYTTMLGLGPHAYHFLFNDSEAEVRLPRAGELDGPVVENLPPEAVIDSPADGTRCAPTDLVLLDARGSDDPDGDALDYAWASDVDGPLGTGASIERTLSTGTHNVTLTLTDAHGAVRTASVVLEVRPYLPRIHVEDVEVDIANPVEGDVVTVEVTLGNDGEARGDGIVVTLLVDGAVAGNDTVSLAVGANRTLLFSWRSERGDHVLRAEAGEDARELALAVRANTAPGTVPALTFEGKVLRVGGTVQFTANATDAEGDALTYTWDFGDGSPASRLENPSHSYAGPSTYTVTLTVRDARGGEAIRTVEVVVERPEKEDSPAFGATTLAMACVGAAVCAMALGRRARRLD